MKTLLLSAPKNKDTATSLHRTFDTILVHKLGPEYAIYANLLVQITAGMKVIIFERISGRQAEGIVAGVNPTGHKTSAGVSRYDVVIRDLHEVKYTCPDRVNRCGVALT
jgi:hypothetical protein